MSALRALGSAIYTKLTNCPGTALWGTQVYRSLAPREADFPYVVFNYVSGGDTNITPKRIVDAAYDVQIMALDDTSAAQGAAYIEAALRDATLTWASGWTHIAVTQRTLIDRVEQSEGFEYYVAGAEYRFRAEQS